MRCKCDVLCEIVVNEKVTSTTLYDVGIKVIKTALIKALGITVSFQRAFEDGQRWAATDRVRQTVPGARSFDGEGAVLRPLLYVASPARLDRPMTLSAGDAVIPHLLKSMNIWRSYRQLQSLKDK